MVGNGDFHADTFLDKGDILFNGTTQSRGREFIGSCQAVSGNSVFIESFCFCYKVFYTAGHRVGTQHTYNSGYTVFYSLREIQLRTAAAETAFTAAAKHMNMLVDEARHGFLSCCIDNRHISKIKIDCRSHRNDFIVAKKNILLSQRLWCINIGIFNESKHRQLPFIH